MCCSIEKMASMSGRIDVEKFSGINFEMWKLKMVHLLIDRDLWDAVDENKFKSTDLTLATQYDVRDNLKS